MHNARRAVNFQYIQYVAVTIAIVFTTIMLRSNSFYLASMDWDEGVYITTAQNWLSGGLPYVTVWDQHPPGLPALLALGQLVIPDPIVSARVMTSFAVMLTASLIQRFAARYFDRFYAGFSAAILYIFCISRWLGLAGNTVVVDNAFVTLAAYLLYSALWEPRTALLRASSGAVALGMALQIKYVVLPEAVLLCLCYLAANYHTHRSIRTTLRDGAVLMVAGCAPTAVAVLYFWQRGALGAFISANIDTNIAYVSLVLSISAILNTTLSGLAPIAGCIAMIALALRRGRRLRHRPVSPLQPHWWIAVWVAAAALDVCLPMKFFTHYYFALYPPLCLASAIALASVAQDRQKHLTLGSIALFGVAVPMWFIGAHRVIKGAELDAPRELVRCLDQVDHNTSNLFVYDYNPAIYALAHLRPPTPYILGSELRDFSESSMVDGPAEIHRVMATSPDFVIIRERPPGEAAPALLDAAIASHLGGYHVYCEMVDSGEDLRIRLYARTLKVLPTLQSK